MAIRQWDFAALEAEAKALRTPYWEGVRLATETTVVTAALELLSIAAVLGVLHAKGGKALYAKGVASNLFNNFALGPVVYAVAMGYFASPTPLERTTRALITLGLIGVHSVGYYLVHFLMHTRRFYWAHRFHHKFNAHVTPSSANAVSLAEYAVAYMLPFVVGALLLRPDALALRYAVGVVSFTNLLIHTPPLADTASSYLPWVFVSTADHIEHHRKLTKNYAAPTISIDRLLAAVWPAGGKSA